MFARHEAIIRLLSDDDPNTVRLVSERLLQNGEKAIGDLTELARCHDLRAANRAREMLARLAGERARSEFGAACCLFNDWGGLEPISWQLALALDPHGDIGAAQRDLDLWGRELTQRLDRADCPAERVRVLVDYLAEEIGLRGNSDDYYSPANSLLPRVVASRRGIPLSLFLVYHFVAARAGMEIEGVNLPGHFLARHEDLLFDPFNGGRPVDEDDCRQILAKQCLPLDPQYLATASPRQILIRTLANLLYAYDLEDKDGEHETVRGWLHSLTDC